MDFNGGCVQLGVGPDTANDTIASGSVMGDGKLHIVEVSYNQPAGTGAVWTDGGTQTTSSTMGNAVRVNPANWNIGQVVTNSNTMAGEIGEIIVYNTVLAVAARHRPLLRWCSASLPPEISRQAPTLLTV